MRYAKWLLVLTLLVLAGCSSGDDNSESEHIIIRTLATEGDTLTLAGGTAVTFPPATFNEETVVIVSDLLGGNDGTAAYFPTPQSLPADLLGALVVNTPADKVLGNDLPVRFQLRDFSQPATSAVPGVSPGDEFAVYRFDPDNLLWNRWGFTYATVENNGDFASATLPTDNLRGFVGSLALFKPNDLGSLPAAQQTVIEGTVVDGGGDGVQTDVTIYVLVGAQKYPFALDDPDAFVPDLPDPQEPTLAITVPNAIMSAADGSFSFQVPQSLVGQLINLSFGLEDASVAGTDSFDVLTPAIVDRAPLSDNEYLDVESVRVQYGENTVRSQPVN